MGLVKWMSYSAVGSWLYESRLYGRQREGHMMARVSRTVVAGEAGDKEMVVW